MISHIEKEFATTGLFSQRRPRAADTGFDHRIPLGVRPEPVLSEKSAAP